MALLVNILARDGICVAREAWIERLFAKEHARMVAIAKTIQTEITQTEDRADLSKRGARLALYESCFRAAHTNDLRANREARISDDERIVLAALASGLSLSADEIFAIEHLTVPIPEKGMLDSLGVLRDMGILFVKKRTNKCTSPMRWSTSFARSRGAR